MLMGGFCNIWFWILIFSLDCLIDSWHQGGFAKCYELKDLATGEVRNFQILKTSSILTKNWSCSCESEALLSRWRRERLCPSRSWLRVIKKRKCLRRSGLLKRIAEQGLNSVFARLHKGVSHAHLVKLFSYFEDSNFVYIVLELCRYFICFPFGGLSSAQPWIIAGSRRHVYCTVCSQKEKSDGVAQEA